MQNTNRPAIGTTVTAVHPNTSWGSGVVVEHVDDPKLKPLIVERSDGTLGYFHLDQVTEA